MPRKKIVIKINCNPSESSNAPLPENNIHDLSEWDIKRILVALSVLLSIAGVLGYFLSSSAKPVNNFQDVQAIGLKSSKQESPDDAEPSRGPDSIGQEKNHILIDRNTRNTQDLKKSVSLSGKLKSLQKAARERKKWVGNVNISRSVFTSGIKRKEPVDNIASPLFALRNEAYSIYFFTELKRLKGHTVNHVWKHNGRVKLKKKFEVRGARWRIYTSKLLNMNMLGHWSVSVVDANGRILMEKGFELKPPLE